MMNQPIPRHFLNQLNQIDQQAKPLEDAIMKGVTEGQLKPGDRLLCPSEISKRYRLTPCEVLDSISNLLGRRILCQNYQGDLFVQGSTSEAPNHLAV